MLRFVPALRTAPAVGETVVVESVPLYCTLTAPVLEYDLAKPLQHGLEIDVEEYL